MTGKAGSVDGTNQSGRTKRLRNGKEDMQGRLRGWSAGKVREKDSLSVTLVQAVETQLLLDRGGGKCGVEEFKKQSGGGKWASI